jgi:hypothetical protein
MSTIEIPQQGEREYFRAFGITALFLAASPAQTPCLIGFTRDLGRSLESIRTRWHRSVELTHAWWLADESGARAIVAAVTKAFPTDDHSRFDAHVDEVAGKIAGSARSLQLVLTDHADALHRVRTAVAHVDGMIEEANASGELRWFNRAYREWRTSAPATVALAMPYGLARSRLRAAIVRCIARGEYRIGLELWGEVLPGATDLQRWRHAPESVADDLLFPVNGSKRTKRAYRRSIL